MHTVTDPATDGPTHDAGEPDQADLAQAHRYVHRRRPSYQAFIGTGAAVGLVFALGATFLRPPNPEFSTSSVLAYLALVFGALGASAGGVVAMVLDRLSDRRS